MKKYRIILFTLFIFIGRIYSETNLDPANPCTDSLFVQLKTIDIDTMSKNQLAYYITNSSDCAIYNNNLILVDSFTQMNKKKPFDRYRTHAISCMSIVWILVLHNNISH